VTSLSEVTVVGAAYWSQHVDDLVQRLETSVPLVRDPSGAASSVNDVMTLVHPHDWAANPSELRAALVMAAGVVEVRAPDGHRVAPGAAPVEARLVYTVDEAATLLGISRSFAYEAVNAGRIPSMRIGRRILVPKAALERFLADCDPNQSSQPPSRTDTHE
jgi:excisionase family DNA binding protein